ncbi:MAG TPA: hypothetical protein VIP56_14330 [Nitrososphaeraceae archaeon]
MSPTINVPTVNIKDNTVYLRGMTHHYLMIFIGAKPILLSIAINLAI